jgi:hypothetical protein
MHQFKVENKSVYKSIYIYLHLKGLVTLEPRTSRIQDLYFYDLIKSLEFETLVLV